MVRFLFVGCDAFLAFARSCWQAVAVLPVACVAEPAMVKAPAYVAGCLSSAAPDEVSARTDPYLVFCATIDSLNELLLDQRQGLA